MRFAAAILTTALVTTAGTAHAQVEDRNGWFGGANGAMSFSEESRVTGMNPVVKTPTMTRQRTAQALALRDEVARMQALNGGTLSAEQQNEVRRRYNRIVGVR